MMKLSRRQLHWLIWSRPLHEVGKLLGMSTVTITKKCRQFNIPRPPRGYWRKIETGRPPQQVMLEKPEEDFQLPLEVVSDDPAILIQLSEQAKPAAQEITTSRAALARRHSANKGSKAAEASAVGIGAEESVGPPGLDPVLPLLLELAEKHDQATKIDRLLAGAQAAVRHCDCLTGAALTCWIDRARSEVRKLDSIQEVIAYCQALVKGDRDAAWWTEARTRTLSFHRDPKV